jgi:hypothetical protein
VKFKKFHPRINLATLFSTESYFLSTIKQAMQTVPWQNLKNLYKRVPLETRTLKLCRTSSWPKRLRETKFKLARSCGLSCRWGTIFCQWRRRRHVIDGKIRIAFFHVLWHFIGNVLSKKIFKMFGVKPILSLIYFINAESKNQCKTWFSLILSRSFVPWLQITTQKTIGFVLRRFCWRKPNKTEQNSELAFLL